MTREGLFAAVRPFAPGQKFNGEMVKAIDALADILGVDSPALSGVLTPSAAGIQLMHEFEGCRLTAYADPGSQDGHPWTIGWGSTGPGIERGVVWTQERADARFAADLAAFSAKVREILAGGATAQSQFDAMVSFAYNVGTGAFASSTLLKKHKAGDFVGARAEFARWNKNDGQAMTGLTRRRAAEAALYGAGQ